MKFKKMVGVALTTVLCLASSITAFAAGITTEEQAILDKLNAGVEVNGIVIQVPAELMNQVENELMKNETDVTAEQVLIVNNKMDEAIAIAQSENITTAEELKASIDKILPIVEEAAQAVGYTVAYDAAKGDVSIADSTGNTVFTTKEVINQTGFDLTATVMVGGVVVTLLAACIVIANKKKLFAKTMEA